MLGHDTAGQKSGDGGYGHPTGGGAFGAPPGGAYTQAPTDMNYATGPGGGFGVTTQASGIAAIEKQVKWKFLFFFGAICVLAASVVTLLHYVILFGHADTWSPCTFISTTFLLAFGFLMMVLDIPMPKPNDTLLDIRNHIYSFALFMTRFTGRGMWYLFLSSHVWVALYDTGVSTFLGIVLTLYLVILGACALAKGAILSKKLHEVRMKIKASDIGPEAFMARSMPGLSKEQFKEMVKTVSKSETDVFTDDDVSYVINALSFTPSSDEQVSLEEYKYWMMEGPMTIV